MGVGQDPVPSGVQWSPDRGHAPLGNDIRRDPDQQTAVIVRPPERPY